MPSFFNSVITCFRKERFPEIFHPLLEVIASGGSGTNVTWSGFISRTRSINLSEGYPSMLNSVVMKGLISLTSLYLMCLSSGLGWTVIPWAPNFWQSMATCSTFGIFPPRAFLNVAILFIFTLNLVIDLKRILIL